MRFALDAMATVAFAGIVAITGAVGYVYVNQDSIVEQVKEAAMAEVQGMIPDLLPGLLGGSVEAPVDVPVDVPMPEVATPVALPF